MKQTGIIGITELSSEIKIRKYKNSGGLDCIYIEIDDGNVGHLTRSDLVGLLDYMGDITPNADDVLSKISMGVCKGTYIGEDVDSTIKHTIEVAESKKEQKPKSPPIDANTPINRVYTATIKQKNMEALITAESLLLQARTQIENVSSDGYCGGAIIGIKSAIKYLESAFDCLED